VIAHVAGVPVEEFLLPLMSGAGAGLLLAPAPAAFRRFRRKAALLVHRLLA
jgi:hypothetical protein